MSDSTGREVAGIAVERLLASCFDPGTLLVGTRLAALNLSSPAALVKVFRRLQLGCIADFNPIHHCARTRRFRHACRGAFMLDHASRAFPVCNPTLNSNREAILPDLGFCQLGPNDGLDLFVLLRTCTLCRGRSGFRGRPGDRFLFWRDGLLGCIAGKRDLRQSHTRSNSEDQSDSRRHNAKNPVHRRQVAVCRKFSYRRFP
jgi:hypothetical protein